MRRLHMNPTFIGLFAVLVWGLSVPVIKLVQEQLGILAWPATTFTIMGLMGLIKQSLGKRAFPDKAVFRNPFFYARWFFFITNLVGIWTAIQLATKNFIPFVTLLNYLWPTFIILCSVALSGVKITRRGAFALGTIIVIAAIAMEVLRPDVLSADLLAATHDRLAYICAIIGAFSWGLYSALSRRGGEKAGGSAVLPIFQLSVGIGALPLSLVPGWAAWNHMTPGLAGILLGWCVLNFLAYLSWDNGMRKGNIVLLSLFADFTPWLSLVASHFILGIAIGDKTISSAILLVFGAITTRYGTLEKKKTTRAKEAAIAQPPAD